MLTEEKTETVQVKPSKRQKKRRRRGRNSFKRALCLRKRLWREAKGRCVYCGDLLRLENVTVDHLLPKTFGGTRNIGNSVASCVDCNGTRSDMLLDRWLVENSERAYNFWLWALGASEWARTMAWEAILIWANADFWTEREQEQSILSEVLGQLESVNILSEALDESTAKRILRKKKRIRNRLEILESEGVVGGQIRLQDLVSQNMVAN